MIIHGDCLEKLKELADNSVDSIVTDPPYGLSFMGKKWDYDVPSVEIWREALRVLKPGGHLLSFGGTRTYHRLVVAIEDAGFEIRDQIQWIYGSGFPKSHNLDGDHKGWGTALKPANEPICVARKPLEKGLTVAANVLKWGTGAINIDGSRIELNGDYKSKANVRPSQTGLSDNYNPAMANQPDTQGRWPANILFDEAAAEMLDEQSGTLKSGARQVSVKKDSGVTFQAGGVSPCESSVGGASRFFYVAKASKSERGDGNAHPTVKPIKLMQYLVKLVTPQNGTVLDPFTGSGSTGIAALKLGFNFIGIEREAEYVEIAKKRMEFQNE